MEPDQSPAWLWLGGALLTVGCALLSIQATLVSGREEPFWGSPAAMASYGFIAIALVCFVAAVRGARFPPFRRRRAASPSVLARSADDELILEVLDEDWDVWRHANYIVEIELRITNTTERTKRLSGGVAMAFGGGLAPDFRDIDLRRELDARVRRRGRDAQLPPHVGPRESVIYWHIKALSRPAEGGHAGYELGVTDEKGQDYVVLRPSESPRPHVWGSLLSRESGPVSSARSEEEQPRSGVAQEGDQPYRFNATTAGNEWKTYRLGTDQQPVALRFFEPEARTVRTADLPAEILTPEGHPALSVERFVDGGVAVRELSDGVTVRAFFYLDEPEAEAEGL